MILFMSSSLVSIQERSPTHELREMKRGLRLTSLPSPVVLVLCEVAVKPRQEQVDEAGSHDDRRSIKRSNSAGTSTT